MENKKKSILPKILQIFALVLMAIFSLTGLAAAYIIFAPDNLPKPFYLQYNYPTPIPSANGTEGVSAVASTETPIPFHEVVPGEGIMINTGTKIINLSEASGRQYIRITIVIELAPSDPAYFEMPVEEKSAYVAEFSAEVTSKLPVIEDALITQISTKTFEQLYTAEGKEQLRLELSNLIMQRLPDYHILSVYFTEFVVE
jgi:flagellar basal body-associated protein FliL